MDTLGRTRPKRSTNSAAEEVLGLQTGPRKAEFPRKFHWGGRRDQFGCDGSNGAIFRGDVP